MFISAVIGGLGSLGGAVLGALYLRGTRWFITDQAWQTLSTGLGVLLVLLILPAGLGGLWVRLRDVGVRLLTGQRVDAPPPTEEPPAPAAELDGDLLGEVTEELASGHTETTAAEETV